MAPRILLSLTLLLACLPSAGGGPVPAPTQFKVISFNLGLGATRVLPPSFLPADRTPQHFGPFLAKLAGSAPTIICLQEVDKQRKRSGHRNVAAQIAADLTAAGHGSWRHWFYPLQNFAEQGQTGIAVLTNLPAQGQPRRLVTFDGPEPRGALALALDLAGGRTLQIVNTHVGFTDPEIQIERILEALTPDHHNPIILCGDFNVIKPTPGQELGALYESTVGRLERAGFIDAGAEAMVTVPAWSQDEGMRIDYVLVHPGKTSSGTLLPPLQSHSESLAPTLNGQFLSDHRALVVTYQTPDAP